MILSSRGTWVSRADDDVYLCDGGGGDDGDHGGYKRQNNDGINVMVYFKPKNFGGFHRVALSSTFSKSNWNLGMLVFFVKGGKPE